ncbi:SDR family NAD(P)-dependent oxidoreductase [Streptomyces sp. NPDC058683]|uniref:SDR family NAD(P)-dependent oxidoreductase n=1 Tax=Streptomyces sp. NPDC058683 TaxID=3346597 RepID=UPI003661ED2B
MTGRLQGKVALITGSARGQGACEAALFAREGAEVVVSDVLDECGEATARSVAGSYLHLDVTSVADWSAAADTVRERFGRLDVLVNNAGIAPARLGRVDELDIEDHLRLFDVNVHGAFYGIRALLPLLRKGRGASVVNVSSIDGLTGIGSMASYVASKHALTGLTRSMAIDLGPLGIRVNSLHPGVIDTPLVRSIGEARAARLARTVGRQPLARMGRSEEVAAMALFLASDEASYCTGSQFTADGGHLAGPYRELPV